MRNDGEGGRLVVMPNASLTAGQAALFLGWMCLLSFGIAGFFAWRGYWLVMPFSGLEMLALAAGLYWSLRGNAYREIISIAGDRVRIETGRRRPEHSWEFPRAWTRVWIEEAQNACDRSRLLLTYAGRRCEIGACLTEEERSALARRLRELLVTPA